ncbi:putative transporter [Actinokineospora spheciospongiae]|uniref:Putative transporter n=1 Tax=Actinokineospora spheciospongiae TaxID=909613 RepID=W7J3X5_9PSEU|nr:MFS transporter [Actinokineospora spheciospongiae]EWC63681.1 putative transporter [Actinokineospora spheciospongiae]PWW66621.1 putative MFS family arabinose efflux permease [Actinokineospora spheciospongiae]
MPTADTEAGTPSATRLLRTNRPLRALFTARVVSYGGDSLSLVALMLHVANTTGQGLAVALLLLVGDFVPSLISPLTGAISDRFDLRRVMIMCEIAQGVLVLMIALALPPLPLLLTLVGLRAIASQIFQPASRAAIPSMVGERDLETANSAVGFGSNCAEAFGPLLAAAMLPFLGIRGVLLVDAASFLLSAVVLLATKPMPPVPDPDADQGTLLTQAKVGLGYILRTPAIRIISLGFCAVVAFNGVDDVALVLLAKEDLMSGDSSVGLLLGAVGIGLLVGYALLTRYSSSMAMPTLLVAGFLVSSAGNFLTGLAWSVAAAFTVQAVRGLGIAGMDVASSTMLQRMVPPNLLGRVFGNLYGAIGVAAAISYVGGGLLLDATDAPTTLMIAGGGGVVFTLLVAVTLPRALKRHTAPETPEDPAPDEVAHDAMSADETLADKQARG